MKNISDDEKAKQMVEAFRPLAEMRLLTPEQPTASLHLCAYCNNPVPNGKFVHQSCEDRHDEREEQADRESGYSHD